jgi:hypothetical protein
MAAIKMNRKKEKLLEHWLLQIENNCGNMGLTEARADGYTRCPRSVCKLLFTRSARFPLSSSSSKNANAIKNSIYRREYWTGDLNKMILQHGIK